jgi:hypothetical protein
LLFLPEIISGLFRVSAEILASRGLEAGKTAIWFAVLPLFPLFRNSGWKKLHRRR